MVNGIIRLDYCSIYHEYVLCFGDPRTERAIPFTNIGTLGSLPSSSPRNQERLTVKSLLFQSVFLTVYFWQCISQKCISDGVFLKSVFLTVYF